MRRIVMGVAILIIFLFRKPLMINSLATFGIKHTTGWWKHLQMGFFLSTGIFILYTAFLFITGAKILQVDAKSPGDLFFQLFKNFTNRRSCWMYRRNIVQGIYLSKLFTGHARRICCMRQQSLFFLYAFFQGKTPGIAGFSTVYRFRGNLSILLKFIIKFHHHFPHLVWHLPGRRGAVICLSENKFPLFCHWATCWLGIYH